MIKILGFIILAVIIIAVVVFSHQSQEDSVKEWAKEQNYQIEHIESHMTTFDTPFYYVNKGNWIFEVDVITSDGNKEKWWVRTGIFGNDYEKGK